MGGVGGGERERMGAQGAYAMSVLSRFVAEGETEGRGRGERGGRGERLPLCVQRLGCGDDKPLGLVPVRGGGVVVWTAHAACVCAMSANPASLCAEMLRREGRGGRGGEEGRAERLASALQLDVVSLYREAAFAAASEGRADVAERYFLAGNVQKGNPLAQALLAAGLPGRAWATLPLDSSSNLNSDGSEGGRKGEGRGGEAREGEAGRGKGREGEGRGGEGREGEGRGGERARLLMHASAAAMAMEALACGGGEGEKGEASDAAAAAGKNLYERAPVYEREGPLAYVEGPSLQRPSDSSFIFFLHI